MEKKYENNRGAWWTESGGITPSLRLDDFDFPALDLIYLDVEGAEPRVLKGARETIEKFHPVIVVEYKPSILIRAGCQNWLDEFEGYRETGRKGKDVVLVHD